MKTNLRLALIALVLSPAVGTLGVSAPAAAAEPGRITVRFDHPEKYTELRDHATDFENERGRERFLPFLQEHLVRRADQVLPPGQKLTVTFTDIDLAGDFEPWRGMEYSDVRIVKDLYVPRMTLTFTLTDAAGTVLKAGERRLLDGAFQMRGASVSSSDFLRYEKAMLNDWLRGEFPVARK